ncbi:MAG: hypothetical protein FJ104_07430 [Deltaproteobacteria bacterium]|nr:hypothetical protein [Deltaproteobacteria bacterium]
MSQIDPFLLRRLAAEQDAILEIVRTQRTVWGGGTKSMSELPDAYGRAQAPRFAQRVRALLDL